MRWMWIDHIVELDKGRRMVAVKCVSLAEDVLHDHFPAQAGSDGEMLEPNPVLPASLLIEGMAQTAGVLVGHTNDFKEKVILAKIVKAKFEREAYPGQMVRFEAIMDRMDPSGAHTIGKITALDPRIDGPIEVGEIELIFSHIDRNMAGTEFPEENFVFADNFRTLLATSNLL